MPNCTTCGSTLIYLNVSEMESKNQRQFARVPTSVGPTTMQRGPRGVGLSVPIISSALDAANPRNASNAACVLM